MHTNIVNTNEFVTLEYDFFGCRYKGGVDEKLQSWQPLRLLNTNVSLRIVSNEKYSILLSQLFLQITVAWLPCLMNKWYLSINEKN
jgi:hypothetical protein